jgi:hypothetical protein
MKRRTLVFAAVTLLTVLSFGVTSTSPSAQEAKDLVGTWAHVSNVNTAADGKYNIPTLIALIYLT